MIPSLNDVIFPHLDMLRYRLLLYIMLFNWIQKYNIIKWKKSQ